MRKVIEFARNRSMSMLLWSGMLAIAVLPAMSAQAGNAFKPAQFKQKNIRPAATGQALNSNPAGASNSAADQSGLTSTITPANRAAGRAKGISDAETRARQARELQRMHDLGSAIDQAGGRQHGGGQQDCRHSPNRAECLRNNMHAGGNSKVPDGNAQRSVGRCLQRGGSLASCRQENKGATPGHLSTGPGSPSSAQHIPGRGQAQQDGEDSGSSPHGGQTGTGTQEQRNTDGTVTRIRTRQYRDGTRIVDTVTKDTHGNEVATSHEERDANGRIIHNSDSSTFDAGNGETRTFVHYDENVQSASHMHAVIPGHRHNDQPAPEGSSAPSDNCNWNPALGKCVNTRSSGKGMTSQPGPDGQDPGASPASAAPHIGSDAATNSGDGAWEARGFGSGYHGKPLDMKDPGHGAPTGGGFVPPPAQ